MHIEGKGTPPVVIDAGLADQLDKLGPLQERLARITQVITYNRAGYGQSEPGPVPRHSGREAEELKALLEKAAVPGPYLLVGHSLGAVNMQVFASRGKPNPAFGEVAAEYQKYWVGQSRALAKRSTNSKFVLAEEATHYLYLDVPELVAENILSVVLEVRAKTSSIIAKCAEAMGGMSRIKAVRTLRLEVVYPDHDASAVLHEIRLPNQIRTERPGEYVAIFDGRTGVLLKYDPAKPGQPPVPQDLPAEAARGFETDLGWFFPLFFNLPAEYAGIVESNGEKCYKLIVSLPLGTRAEYLIDPRTYMVKTVAVDETFQGQTFHMEREWLDFKSVQGIIYPSRMTYPGRDGKMATARLQKIEFNPVLAEDRFKIQAAVARQSEI